MRKAQVEIPLNGGTQRLYSFENGRGASVIRHKGSYGYGQGLWELAVLRLSTDGLQAAMLDYTTEITGDVLGYLREEEVDAILARIEELPDID